MVDRTSIFDPRIEIPPSCYLEEQGCIAIGGYIDGGLRIIYKTNGKLKFVIFPGKSGLPDAYCPVITAVGKVADHLVVGNEEGSLFAYRLGEQELLGLG